MTGEVTKKTTHKALHVYKLGNYGECRTACDEQLHDWNHRYAERWVHVTCLACLTLRPTMQSSTIEGPDGDHEGYFVELHAHMFDNDQAETLCGISTQSLEEVASPEDMWQGRNGPNRKVWCVKCMDTIARAYEYVGERADI